MAEIFGAVAGGLAVAEVGLKVGGTVWRLKKLWEEVQEVPETVRELMRQIEIMDPILSDYENNLTVQNTSLIRQFLDHDSTTAIQCAAHCREALEDLRHLAEDLEGAVVSERRSRRAIARITVMLKKSIIKGFQDRLERATKLLQLSQMNYLTANAAVMGAIVTNMWTAVADMKAQQKLMLQQLSDSNSSYSKFKPPFPVVTHCEGTGQRQPLVKKRRAQRQENSISLPRSGLSIFGAITVRKSKADSHDDATYGARIHLPNWLLRRVWDISVSRACSGWQVNLSTWNIVPDDSPGLFCVKSGDLDGLVDLFSRRLASPQDCDERGRTLFYWACQNVHTHIVNYFMNAGLDMINTGIFSIETWRMILWTRDSMEIIQPLTSRGFFEQLANVAEDFGKTTFSASETPAHTMNVPSPAWFIRCQESFKLYVRTRSPFWYDLSPASKQGSLLLDDNPTGWTTEAIRMVTCPNGPIQKSDVQEWQDDNASLLCLVFVLYFASSWRVHIDQDWATLLTEVITATDDLQYMVNIKDFTTDFTGPVTAFGAVLKRHSLRRSGWLSEREDLTRSRVDRLTLRLQSLMSLLASCGHDVLDFGRKEAAIWVSGNNTANVVGDVLYLGFDSMSDGKDGYRHLRAVHYGAEPKDWYFEVGYPYEDYAGDFWNLIENPPLLVPGAWIDEG